MADEQDRRGHPSASKVRAGGSFARPGNIALTGAAGFGVGGAVVGLAGNAMILAFALMGALGAGALCPILNDWKRRIYLVLAGLLGFLIGLTAPFFTVLTVWDPESEIVQFGLIGVTGGALGGAALGAVLGGWKTTGWLALAGAAGFGLGLILVGRPGVHPALVFGLPGVLAGALMGFVAAWRGSGAAAR